MTHLVQIRRGDERRVAVVDSNELRLLRDVPSVYDLAWEAMVARTGMLELIENHLSDERVDYDKVYDGASAWRLMVAVDHPQEPARCLVSGTGLTHLGSARERQAMHTAADEAVTDSMKMFQWGLERGRPGDGEVGVAPEWFYKGCGTILRAPGEGLEIPAHGEDGGEEGEIAGIYLIGPDARPWRLGMTIGNEFSDHVFEKRNYLNLAGSKIRTCSIGPELVLDPSFDSVAGRVAIEREGTEIWAKDVRTGEKEMCHSLRNIEHHHFKFATHCRPADLHVHFYGADSLSFGDGIKLADGDVMNVSFTGFGRALRNTVRIATGPEEVTAVREFNQPE